MKVSRLITRLQEFNPNAEVVLNSFQASPLLFVLARKDNPFCVCLAGEDYCGDLSDELTKRYEQAARDGIDELDFYSDLIDDGYDYNLIRKYFGFTNAEAFKDFTLSHGLLSEKDFPPMEKLQPCDVCGSEYCKVIQEHTTGFYYVECQNCGALSIEFLTAEEAIAACRRGIKHDLQES